MHLSLKVIIAMGIFLISAIAITGLSLRLLAATKLSDKTFLQTESVVRTTFQDLKSDLATLQDGETTLEELNVDGSNFQRVQKVSSDTRMWRVELVVEKKDEKSVPQTYVRRFLKE